MKDNYYDSRISNAKAVCIILMVIGHSGCPEYLCNWIYLFHMPCFFFVSGCLFNEKYLSAVWHGIRRRIKGLWWPFVKWSVIFLLLHNLFFSLHFYQRSYSWTDIWIKLFHIITLTGSEQLLGGFWFLKELLYASIISLVFMRLGKNLTVNIKGCSLAGSAILLILSFIVGLLPFKIPTISSVTMLATSYYLTGIWFYRWQNKYKYNVTVGFVALMTIFIMSFFFVGSMQIQGWSIFIYFAISLVGIFAVINLAGICQRSCVAVFLDYVGMKTIYILVFHFISFKLVSLIKIWQYDMPLSTLSSFPVIDEYNTFYWIIYSFIGVIVPLVLWESTQKIRELNYLK